MKKEGNYQRKERLKERGWIDYLEKSKMKTVIKCVCVCVCVREREREKEKEKEREREIMKG